MRREVGRHPVAHVAHDGFHRFAGLLGHLGQRILHLVPPEVFHGLRDEVVASPWSRAHGVDDSLRFAVTDQRTINPVVELVHKRNLSVVQHGVDSAKRLADGFLQPRVNLSGFDGGSRPLPEPSAYTGRFSRFACVDACRHVREVIPQRSDDRVLILRGVIKRGVGCPERFGLGIVDGGLRVGCSAEHGPDVCGLWSQQFLVPYDVVVGTFALRTGEPVQIANALDAETVQVFAGRAIRPKLSRKVTV